MTNALSRRLTQAGWRLRAHGQPVPLASALARDGWLPALLVAAVADGAIEPQALLHEGFVGSEEPHAGDRVCGFAVETDPAPERWAMGVWRHLRANQHQGCVNLDAAWAAWCEGLKATLQSAGQGPLRLRWEPAPPG